MATVEAAIFGNLNTAIFWGGDAYHVIDENLGTEPRLCRVGEVAACIALDPSYSVVAESLQIDDLHKRVENEKKKSDALFFVLASLDERLLPETRLSAAEFANELIADSALFSYLRSILLSEALPDPTLHRPNAATGVIDNYDRLMTEVEKHQPALRKFWMHWNKLEKDASFANEGVNGDLLREAMLRLGVVPKLVNAIEGRKVPSFNAEVITFALNPEVQRTMPQALRTFTVLRNSLEADGAFEQDRLFPAENKSHQEDARPAKLQQSHSTQTSHSMFQQVSRQIDGIRRLLLTGSMSNVTKAVTELLEFQKDSDTEYLAKTLCNLAAIALDANEPHLAQYLSDRAFDLGEEDEVIYTTRAEVFKRLGKFDEARSAYEETITRFGRSRYAINGYADVLMDSGRFDQSLEVYNETARLYPDDPVASNGIATVLFARGQADAALRIAQKNVSVYGDAVSRTICGNLLRHVGRYSEAVRLGRESVRVLPLEVMLWNGLVRSLALMRDFERAHKESDEMRRRFPEIPFPWLIRGEILNRAGDVGASLDAYTTGLKTFTSHRPLQIGRAAMLILLGRQSEALEMLKGLELDSEIDWRAYHVLALSKLKAGQTDEAIRDLDWASKHTPWRTLRVVFESSLGYAYLRQGQQRIAIQLFEGNLLRAAQSKRQGLLLFLGKAFQEMGQTRRSESYLRRASPTDKSTEFLLHTISGTTNGRLAEQIEVAEFDVLLAAA